MAQLEWDSSMSVGVDEIDAQHRQLLDIINNLYDAIVEGSFEDLAPAREKAFRNLGEYTNTHFRSEEDFMTSIAYPEIEEHRKMHLEFAEKMEGYRQSIADGSLILSSDIMRTLLKWFRDHFLTEDRKYADFNLRRSAGRV